MRRERKHLQKVCPKTLSKSHLQCLLCPTTHGSSDNLIYIFINLLCISVLSANIEIQGGWSYLSVVPSIPIQKSISLQTTLFCPGSFLASVSVGVCCLLLSSILLRFRKTKPLSSKSVGFSPVLIFGFHASIFPQSIVFLLWGQLWKWVRYEITRSRILGSSEPRNLQQHGGGVCTHHYNPPCAGGGLEEWRLNMGGRGVNRKETTHNTTEAEVVKSLQYSGGFWLQLAKCNVYVLIFSHLFALTCLK